MTDTDPATCGDARLLRAMLSERVRYAREVRGFSQATLAIRLHTDPSYVSQLECRHRLPSVVNLARLASVLGVHCGWLLGLEAQTGWDEDD
jgi:transcriptional regulator with XRE-family HTH domain